MHLSYFSPPTPNFHNVCSVSPPSLTFPLHTHLTLPSPLHPHPLPGWVVCCLGHWRDVHLSLQYGYTPLREASRGGHDGCVQLLLDRGAQIDHQDKVVSAFRDQPHFWSQWCRKFWGQGGNCPQTFVRGRVLPPTPTVIP